jgi:hypothetical protein
MVYVRFLKINNSNFKTKGFRDSTMSITNKIMDKLLELLKSINSTDIDSYIKEQSKLKTNPRIYNDLNEDLYSSITSLNKLLAYFQHKYYFNFSNTVPVAVEKDEILTYTSASKLLQVDKKTIQNWKTKYSDFPLIQIGAVPRIKKSSLMTWLNQHNKSMLN